MKGHPPRPVVLVQLTDATRTTLLRSHLEKAGCTCPEAASGRIDVLLTDANRQWQPLGEPARVTLSLGACSAAAYELPVEASPWQVTLAVRMGAEIARLRTSLELAEHTGEQLADEALRDPLTGIGNRRAWDQWLEAQLESSSSRTLCVAILDLDHFKSINDSFGHPLGDQVLSWVATAIGKTIRKQDFVARLGGDEFIFGLVDVPAEALSGTIQRVRHEVSEAVVDVLPQPLTASVGYATDAMLSPAEQDLPVIEQGQILYAKADTALHSAKRGGRDQAVSAS